MSLSQLGTRPHKLGTMGMEEKNTEVKVTIRCPSRSSSNVTIKFTPKIPRNLNRNKELLTTTYKAEIEVRELPAEPEVEFQTQKMTKKFTLSDRDDFLQWTLLSKQEWVKPNSHLPDVFISIRVLHEKLVMRDDPDDPEFVNISKLP